jgi:hypothetical protein
VSIQQLDARGRPISSDTTSVTAPVASDNGTSDPSDEEASSAYLSTAFVSGAMVKDPNAATVRFLISPQSAQTFDVLNAWLAAWPAATAAPAVATSATRNNVPAALELPPTAGNHIVAHPARRGSGTPNTDASAPRIALLGGEAAPAGV